ncbi:hypothetical protein BJ508DRAFT_324096 [Ascobolus immersus RN42]|uniref:Uncharacterized protein n=1 Tax=Ascobolus immersus RN42 TaxID=1160509 RepID=A0A3N4IEA4_ASCIM|nr:hypothetical protein BJ508DRAFT_324096 [Ascobolus immersus RN42]
MAEPKSAGQSRLSPRPAQTADCLHWRLRAICGLSPATTSGPKPVDLTKEGELGKTTSLFPNLQGQRKRQFFGLGPANNTRPAAGLKERKEGDFL